jgi:hypothetical protein
VSATRFGDAVTALVAAYTAAPALAGIPVYDGIQPQTVSDAVSVIVGHDGTLEADGTLVPDVVSGTFAQQWIEMGDRQESGTVNCVIVCQSGDATGLGGLRVQAAALLGALEDAADASGGFAGGLTHMTFDGTLNGRWIYRQSLAGAAVMVAYRVAYSTDW